MKTQISVLFVLVVGLVPSALAQPFNCGPGYPNYPNEDSAITNLRACVAIAGSTCPVPAGVHCIYKYDTYVALDYYNIGILITASNVTIQGSAASGPSGTVLTRGVPSTGIYGMRDAKTILSAAAGVTGVWIEDLEFDGNRYLVQSPAPPRGVGLGACATSFDGFLDVDLTQTNYPNWVSLFDTWFVNGPFTSVTMNGTGIVELGTFGAAGTSSGTYQTAIYLWSSASAEDNSIYYAGTAAVTANPGEIYYGLGPTIYANYLYENRYAGSTIAGGAGGVITIYPDTDPALIAYNLINQENYAPSRGTINGCTSETEVTSGGIEVYGYGHSLYNNGVYAAGGAISVGGSNPTSEIYITGNQFGADEGNYWLAGNYGGVLFSGTSDTCGTGSCPNPASAVTLDHLRVYYDTSYEVYFGGGVSGEGFINSQCIDTSLPNYGVQSVGVNSLTYPNPLSFSCP
jgi:hypothetical protein